MDELFKLYNSSIKSSIGEKITQKEHAIQAGYLAYLNNEDPSMIIACLFHDVGHLLDYPQMEGDLGTRDHEKIGSDFIRKFTNDQVADLISNHVKSKKYLCQKYPEYLNSLSEASRNTLKIQGSMSQEEMFNFESSPNFSKYLRLRGYDDEAKITPHPENYPDLSFFKQFFEIVRSDSN